VLTALHKDRLHKVNYIKGANVRCEIPFNKFVRHMSPRSIKCEKALSVFVQGCSLDTSSGRFVSFNILSLTNYRKKELINKL